MYALMAVCREESPLPYLLDEIPCPDCGFDPTVHYADAAGALDAIRAARPDAVLLDMSGEQDDALIGEICLAGCECIVLRRDAQVDDIRRAMRAGAFDYCASPLTAEILREMLQALRQKLDKKISGLYSMPDERLARMTAYIQSHLDQRLSLAQVAGEFYMSRNYLCSFFKKHLHMSFVEYLTAERIKRAKALLATPATLSEIAEKSGFADTPYFIKVFKKSEGMSPGAYRKRLRGETP